MKVYLKTSVLEESLARIERLYREFETVVVGVSGGKDSSVVLSLALVVARRLNRLPVHAMFLDQEAERQSTIDMIRTTRDMDGVSLRWLQVPFDLMNGTSATEPYLHCWDESRESDWMRKKETAVGSVHDNHYGATRFHEMFRAIIKADYGDNAVYLAGVRAEESPARLMGLTRNATYQDITWGKKLDESTRNYTFYPIYDWSLSDVWTHINRNAIPYNAYYDIAHRLGVPRVKMRVSALVHETAVVNLFNLQEIEVGTYSRLTQRIGGIDAAAKLGVDDYVPTSLPSAFGDWREYRDYLVEHLPTSDELRVRYRAMFATADKRYLGTDVEARMLRVCIKVVVTNDWCGTAFESFQTTKPSQDAKRQKAREAAVEEVEP